MMKTFIALLMMAGLIVAGSPPVRIGNASTVLPLPDYGRWSCSMTHLTHVIIETYECHDPGNDQISHILLKVTEQDAPFLIGWNHDERAANPRENAYAAIRKDDRWIVGARGTGFTARDTKDSVIFYIFLTKDFAVRESVEIKIPEIDKETKPVARTAGIRGR